MHVDGNKKVDNVGFKKLLNFFKSDEKTLQTFNYNPGTSGYGLECEHTEDTPFCREDLADKRWVFESRIAGSYDDIQQGSHSGIKDARFTDISKINLTEEQLLNLTIDKTTVLSDEQRQVIDTYIDKMKDPGLGVRTLHKKGITGKGIKIAIIDQSLGEHQEYSDRVIHYENISDKNYDNNFFEYVSMHGPAVTSIAAGKDVGVAPESEIVYFAALNGNSISKEDYMQDIQAQINKAESEQNEETKKEIMNSVAKMQQNLADSEKWGCPITVATNKSHAEAINKILDANKKLADKDKVPVISISWGFDSDAEGFDEVMQAIDRAKKEGVLVLSTRLDETHGINLLGANRNPKADPNDPKSYKAGAYWENLDDRYERAETTLLVPMDHRTVADMQDDKNYRYEGNDGGMSWAVPYLAGVYALAKQVNPKVTPDEFFKAAFATSNECRNPDGRLAGQLINPEALLNKISE